MPFTGKATFSAGPALPEIAEDVSDIVGIVSPHETPLLDHLGDPRREARSTVHEWIEDALVPNAARIDQPALADDGATTLLTVDDARPFRPGDLVRVASTPEVVQVAGVSGQQITVVRGYGGTPTTIIQHGMAVVSLGTPALEGADAAEPRFTARVRRRNYTQIFAATVEVSGSMQAARAHGVGDEEDYQRQERLRELLRDLENTVINGVAPAEDPQGSGTVRRSMNGLRRLITTNRFAPGADGFPSGAEGDEERLTEEMLNTAMRAVWEQSSGQLDTILVGGAQKRRINAFAGNRAYTPDDARYRDMISVYESDFGVCRVILSRWVPPSTVMLLDSSRIEVLPLAGRAFHYKPLAARGDAVGGQLIGEYTLELRNENAHAVIEGLTS